MKCARRESWKLNHNIPMLTQRCRCQSWGNYDLKVQSCFSRFWRQDFVLLQVKTVSRKSYTDIRALATGQGETPVSCVGQIKMYFVSKLFDEVYTVYHVSCGHIGRGVTKYLVTKESIRWQSGGRGGEATQGWWLSITGEWGVVERGVEL